MSPLGQQAVVIGGSIAGLITARVLADHFDRVVVLERDDIEDRPVVHRSVPQGHHLHGLLQGGQQVLSQLYPAFPEQLRELGAPWRRRICASSHARRSGSSSIAMAGCAACAATTRGCSTR